MEGMQLPVIQKIVRFRRVFVFGLYVCLILIANYVAFWLRFDGVIPLDYQELLVRLLPLLVLVRGLTFIPFRMYEGLWRYTGIWDLRNIIAGVLCSSLVFYLIVHWVTGLTQYPRSVFVIDSLLLIFLLGGLRLARRIHRELGHLEKEKKILIYGAGDAGESIVRDMRNNAWYKYEPIGFIDDQASKVGQRIHGVPVLGTRKDLVDIMSRKAPHEVLVAMHRPDPATIRDIVKTLEPFKVPITTLPNLQDIMNGKVAVSQIRNLSVEDLLTRAVVGLDPEPVRKLIAGKRIMVTGAGGSIGSELCRQIAGFQPKALILFERYENGLYAIENDLVARYPSLSIYPAIGDVTDSNRVNAVISAHSPEIIFHAAAHKHVPLMELNVCEAVKNNIVGTRTIAEAAEKRGVERFILISTDKAVNPSSVMGASKRMAELIVQAMAARHTTCFEVVRFGNVLNSNGSVVPRFLEQIKAGGPVTVTHPEMRRYFMLISEAVQLVLHAAAMGECGGIYVLEMGEQLKVLEVARNLIRLAGCVPEREIPISFVGLRPGEKLSEELVGTDETVEPSSVEKILRVRSSASTQAELLWQGIARLELLAARGESDLLIEELCKVIPSFQPMNVSKVRTRVQIGQSC